MKKRPASSLPLQILTFVVVPSMVLVLLVAFGGVALHQSAMRDMVLDHNLHAVRGAASGLSEQLEERYSVLFSMVQRAQLQNSGKSIDGSEFWGEPLFTEGIAYYDSQGSLLAASSDAGIWDNTLIRAAILDGGVRYLSLIQAGNEQINIVILAMEEGRDMWAVGVTSLDSLILSDVLQSLHPDTDTDVMLITSKRTILYHSDASQIGQSLPDNRYTNSLLGVESGAEYVNRGQPDEVVATFARVPASGWVLVQEESWQRSLGLLTRYSLAAPLVLVPGLLIAGAAVWFGIRRIVQPLQRLEKRATDLAWGDFESIEQPVGGIEEIKQLQATLKHLASRVRSTQVGMRNYIAAITQTQEDERTRLARELHDQTVQTLIALGHREQRLKRFVGDTPEAVAILDELRQMTTQAVEDLRRIIRAMRPIYLEELGLLPALEMLAHDLNLNERSIKVSFEKSGKPRRLSPDHELALYRVTQEALNNIWQHSRADQAWLSVAFDDDVVVTVRDNGQGFEAPRRVTDLSGMGHFGIMGMYERAALIGAHLQINSQSGRGTTITIRVPAPTFPLADEP
jgi:signal transduction histidine kinase